MSTLLALGAGCSSNEPPPQPNGLAKSDEIARTATQFAQCMRDNGYQIPDPSYNEDGLPVFGGEVPGLVKDERFEEVRGTCAEPLSAALAAAGVENKKEIDPQQFLAFTRCMREHGIDMPDPTAEDPLAIPKSAFNSPAWEPAKEACKPHLPEAWRSALDNVQKGGKPGGGR